MDASTIGSIILGALVVIVGQLIQHRLALKRDNERWSREEPERRAARELQESLEKQRLRHSYRKERLDAFLSEFDTLLKSINVLDLLDKPEFSDDLKIALERQIPAGVKILQESASTKAMRLIEQLPAITDPSTRSKVDIALLALLVPQEIRSMLLEGQGKDLITLTTEAYGALESYVIAEP